MSNIRNNQSIFKGFDYSRNIINYNNREYPFRILWFDDYNCNVIVSVSSLNYEIFDKYGIWLNSLAEYIDSKIVYYVEDDEIEKPEPYLQKILKNMTL